MEFGWNLEFYPLIPCARHLPFLYPTLLIDNRKFTHLFYLGKIYFFLIRKHTWRDRTWNTGGRHHQRDPRSYRGPLRQRFESLLEDLFGAKEIQTYRNQFPSDWLSLMNDFEGKKRGKRILDSSVMTNIRLPRSFVSMANQTKSSAMERYGEKEVKLQNNEYLSLSSRVMRGLFIPVMKSIKEHLKTLLKKPKLSKVQIMLLVGGFADSAFLQGEIKKEFSENFRVLVPYHAITAVVEGAVIFGKNPSKIIERVVCTTYGTDRTINFVEGVHTEEKKFIVDGVEKCADVFKCFVKENTVVKLGQKITKRCHLATASTTSIHFDFYVTSNPNTQFVTDRGATQIGSLVVQSPDTRGGKDRHIEVSMYFGGTEITATAWDVSSGNRAQTTLDFFYRS